MKLLRFFAILILFLGLNFDLVKSMEGSGEIYGQLPPKKAPSSSSSSVKRQQGELPPTRNRSDSNYGDFGNLPPSSSSSSVQRVSPSKQAPSMPVSTASSSSVDSSSSVKRQQGELPPTRNRSDSNYGDFGNLPPSSSSSSVQQVSPSKQASSMPVSTASSSSVDSSSPVKELRPWDLPPQPRGRSRTEYGNRTSAPSSSAQQGKFSGRDDTHFDISRLKEETKQKEEPKTFGEPEEAPSFADFADEAMLPPPPAEDDLPPAPPGEESSSPSPSSPSQQYETPYFGQLPPPKESSSAQTSVLPESSSSSSAVSPVASSSSPSSSSSSPGTSPRSLNDINSFIKELNIFLSLQQLKSYPTVKFVVEDFKKYSGDKYIELASFMMSKLSEKLKSDMQKAISGSVLTDEEIKAILKNIRMITATFKPKEKLSDDQINLKILVEAAGANSANYIQPGFVRFLFGPKPGEAGKSKSKDKNKKGLDENRLLLKERINQYSQFKKTGLSGLGGGKDLNYAELKKALVQIEELYNVWLGMVAKLKNDLRIQQDKIIELRNKNASKKDEKKLKDLLEKREKTQNELDELEGKNKERKIN